MVDQNNFLDLYDVFVNELFGSLTLFVSIGIVIILILCVKFKVPMQTAFILSGLWVAIIYASYTIGVMMLWVLLVLGIGTFFYYTVSRALKRG